MTIYIILIAVVLSQYFFAKKQILSNNAYLVLCFILITSTGAFGYFMGSDTINYVDNFRRIGTLNSQNFTSFDSTYQPGFVWILAFFKTLSNNYLYYQIGHSILVNTVIFLFIKKYSPNVGLSLFFYLMLNYLDYNFEIQRESLCIIIGLGLFMFLDKYKNIKTYVFSIVICILTFLLLHRSAFILLLYPLLKRVKMNYRKITVLFFITLFIQVIWSRLGNISSVIDIVGGDVYKGYLQQELNNYVTYSSYYLIRHSIVKVIIPFAIITISFYVRKDSKFTLFAILSVMFECLTDFTFAFHRMYGYFVPFYWLALTDVFIYIYNRWRINRYLVIICVSLYIIYTYHSVYFVYDTVVDKYVYERYFPYVSVFENGNDY